MGPERQHRGDELLLIDRVANAIIARLQRYSGATMMMIACGQEGCGPEDNITFALAVFLTRPQAEHQIGATSEVPDSARNVTAESRLS